MTLLSLYALLMLGVLAVGLWHLAFGRCRVCQNERSPRCGCDEDGKRKPWINRNR